jgi:hypothetical protein
LESLGVSLAKARAETLKVLKQSPAGGGTAEQETQSPSESAAQEAQHLLVSVPGVLGMQGVPAFLHGRHVHWDYMVAEVEYPGWDDLDDPAARVEHPRPEAIGLIKRFLGTDEARAGLYGMPMPEALRILGAEGWALAAIDHPAPEGGPSGHYYVFKRSRSTFTVDAPSVALMPLQLDPIVDQVLWKLEPLLAQRGQRARKAYSVVPSEYSVEGDELIIDAVVRGDVVRVSVEDHVGGWSGRPVPFGR